MSSWNRVLNCKRVSYLATFSDILFSRAFLEKENPETTTKLCSRRGDSFIQILEGVCVWKYSGRDHGNSAKKRVRFMLSHWTTEISFKWWWCLEEQTLVVCKAVLIKYSSHSFTAEKSSKHVQTRPLMKTYWDLHTH